MHRHLISDAHEWINQIPTVHSQGNGLGIISGERRPLEMSFFGFLNRFLKIFLNCLEVVESKFWQA